MRMNVDKEKVSIDLDINKLIEEKGYNIAILHVLMTFFNFLYIFPDAAVEINDNTGNMHLISYTNISREKALAIRRMFGDDPYRVTLAEVFRGRWHDILFLAKTKIKMKKETERERGRGRGKWNRKEKEKGKGKGEGKGKGQYLRSRSRRSSSQAITPTRTTPTITPIPTPNFSTYRPISQKMALRHILSL